MSYIILNGRKPQLKRAGFGGFGQSASSRESVKALQWTLRRYWEDTGNDDYFPGQVDGLYGREIHAAVIRVGRDLFGWTAGPGCQSLCNTLTTRAEDACAECIKLLIPRFNAQFSGAAFTEQDALSIADAYHEFLRAYIAEYGEGGELDPAQIARREDVSREEAERLAAERAAGEAAEAARLAAAAEAEEAARLATEEEAARLAAEESARLAAEEEAARGVRQLQRAGFSWWWILLLVGVGSGVAYWAYQERKKGTRDTPARQMDQKKAVRALSPEQSRKKNRSTKRGVLDFSGPGCGCGGG